MRVATDVGGTFTDLVCVDDDGFHVAKASTTPPNFERGLLDALDQTGLEGADVKFFAHGTTVVINALLSRRGARTALVTTAGFRDVLEIARGNRPVPWARIGSTVSSVATAGTRSSPPCPVCSTTARR